MKKGNNRWLRRLLGIVMMLALLAGSVMSVHAEGTGLKLDLSASVTGDEAESINGMLSTANFSLQAGQTETGAVRVALEASLLGQNLVKALLEAGPEKIALAFPDVDDHVYEFQTAKLMEMFQEILQGEGSAFNVAPPDFSAEEVSTVIAPYFNYLAQTIGTGVQTQEEAEIELVRLGKTVTGPTAVYEPSAEDIAEIMNGLADMLAEDEAAAALVEKIADYLENTEGLDTILNLTGTGGESMTPAEAAAAIRENFPKLPEMMKDAAASLSEEGMGNTVIRVTVGATPDGSAPCKIAAYIGEEELGEYYEFGFENDAEAAGYRICLYADSSDEEYDLVAESGSAVNGPSGSVSFRMNMTPVAVLTYEWDLSTRTLIGLPAGTAKLEGMGMSAAFTAANNEESGSDYMIGLDGLDKASGSSEITGAKLTLHADLGEAPEAADGEPVDITEYTTEQLAELASELGEKLSARISAIFGE